MKLKFNPDLNFQQDAINSITDIFKGQEIFHSSFTVPKNIQMEADFDKNSPDIGKANRISINDEMMLENVRRIQLKNGLKQSENIKSMNFNIEMETGTGKTYVFLRTILELKEKYDLNKFIIVVPSVAIREGIKKSLDITREHFKELYNNLNYEYFIYDSDNLQKVRDFATSDSLQIMIINIQAFRKEQNVINRPYDKMDGYKPISLIQNSNPIVIIDEPQSVDNTEKSKNAIRNLNPLASFRYSATHKEKYNLMYKLDAVDAYNKKLVKQIEVASIKSKNFNNAAYIKLVKVKRSRNKIKAEIILDMYFKGKVKRKKRTVKSGDDLYDLSGERDIYKGYRVAEISMEPGNEYISFTPNGKIVQLNEEIGAVDQSLLKRLQIRKTIKEHLEKEKRLNKRGIKVLSLFFIDKVSKYRIYNEDGSVDKGEYAQVFEEEYRKMIQEPQFNELFDKVKDIDIEIDQIHNGYFAKDKKGNWKETKDSDSSKNSKAASEVFELIMKDKEQLLSFDSNLRFIFSHSALREGWDNPNVFQICTLVESKDYFTKRQKIGRGLRLCVNQAGERVFGFDVNTLTVMANDHYEDFVKQLQTEIEKEEGIRFGIIEPHTFARVNVGIGEEKEYLGEENSEQIYNHFKNKGYIDSKGKVQDKLKIAIRENKIELPEEFEEIEGQIRNLAEKFAGDLNIKDSYERKKVHLNKQVFLSPEFRDLWDRIKHKTTYSVHFNTDQLKRRCIEAIQSDLDVNQLKFDYKKARVEITEAGTSADVVKDSSTNFYLTDIDLPDIVSYIQNSTNLTRKTIVDILLKSKRLDDFRKNPQKFIESVIKKIQFIMKDTIVDGIKYEKLDNEYYLQTEFENQELQGYLKKNLQESKKSPYEYVVYDSNIEKNFALHFENSDNIKVYAKLPNWFKINTPLGSYNPDWAVLYKQDYQEKLYFIIESKGNISKEQLRFAEDKKIECGKKHFKALNQNVKMVKAASMDDFENRKNS